MLPFLFGLAIVCAGSMAGAAKADDSSIARGKALVTENCSGCHAIGLDGASPHPQAPPFRDLSDRFPIDALEETSLEPLIRVIRGCRCLKPRKSRSIVLSNTLRRL